MPKWYLMKGLFRLNLLKCRRARASKFQKKEKLRSKRWKDNFQKRKLSEEKSERWILKD